MLREKEKYRAICIYPKRIAAFDVENLEETRRCNTVKGERERDSFTQVMVVMRKEKEKEEEKRKKNEGKRCDGRIGRRMNRDDKTGMNLA